MTQSTFINARTGDYELQDGQLVVKNALLTEAYTRLMTPIGTYQFDVNFGSELPGFFNTRQKLTATKATTIINDALQPMITQGRAKTIDSQINAITLNALIFSVSITDVNNKIYNLPVNFMGTI